MGSTESTLPSTEDSSGGDNRNLVDRANTTRPNQVRRETDTNSNEIPADDPWWWEIENQNLLLDRVPNVTTESDGNTRSDATLSENFNTLLKIGENVNLNNTANSNRSEIVKELKDRLTKDNTTTDYTSNEYRSKINSEERETHVQSLEEFKQELHQKRMARQLAVQDLREEITSLREQLATEQELTRRLRAGEDVAATQREQQSTATNQDRQDEENAGVGTVPEFDEDDENASSRSRHANIELANVQLALQMANSENLSLHTELGVVQKQVGALKEVVACCKQMLVMKEEQCTQLKTKLCEIEESFGEREMKIMSDNLRQEYERQLGNIRQLRQLYEERQRIAAAEQENLQRLVSIKKDELVAEQERTKNFEERNQTLLKEVESANNELATLREECNEHKFEKKALKEEMGAVNTLFSQMVMGFNGKNNLDIDRLATMLEENRTLLNDMATKEANCSDGATLPKLLFELVEQAAVGAKCGSTSRNSSRTSSRSATPLAPDAGQSAQDVDQVDEVVGKQVDGMQDVSNTQDAENVEKCVGHEVHDFEQTKQDERGASASMEEDNANNNASMQQQQKSVAHKTKMSTSSIAASATASCSIATSSATLKFHEPEVIGKVASTQEIIGNLPKVWKVLMELLSHHKIEQVQFEENGASEDCYKSVETPNGPKTELSVSKTYIKLKDLILEKKSLVKETSRLKTLNCHLDYRLNEQEKRLSAVSLELTKTWHLVGKMQRQHRQLHTQEQILRYQLQQKRRLLSELKDELEYCRRKWAAARAKNDESQEQCNDLRREFAKRKLEDANNSAESGYSDSGPPSDEEERAGRAVDIEVAACSSNNLREMFEHSRKIKRMQSTSPGRAICNGEGGAVGEIVLRWNSAPPTCGWRDGDDEEDRALVAPNEATGSGAIPKHGTHSSRTKQRGREETPTDDGTTVEHVEVTNSDIVSEQTIKPATGDRAVRIQRLEEQCKSLIQQVLETSDNRERLEVQLCRFQDEIAPVQYAVPLDDFISKKRLERMTRASSAPASGSLTPREEEYTRKRSERLERLEEESRQLISRIKRTSDRGHYLRCSLDRLHRGRAAGSREGSFESNTEEELNNAGEVEIEELKSEVIKSEEPSTSGNCALTATEEAYTARRSERLRRLEEEGKQLLTQLSKNSQRGGTIATKLDVLHEKFSGEDCSADTTSTRSQEQSTAPETKTPTSPTIEKRMENIERISTNRDERLRILEEEGKQLISRLSSTSERGTRMINHIAEREQNRLSRQAETPTRETATANDEQSMKQPVNSTATIAVVGALLPILKNAACSSIVSEELAECVTVTTTPSQIAHASQQGAVPKSKPVAQLSAGKTKSKTSTAPNKSNDMETLEDMVKRLKDLPFPAEETPIRQQAEENDVVPQDADKSKDC